MKQKRDRYEMHKYWGKKPSNDLKQLIEAYSEEGDTVLDPFSGYGVFCCEAFILNRNVISNDLNPVANFINQQLLERNVDLALVKKQWELIKTELEPFVMQWFEHKVDGQSVMLNAILRSKEDVPLRAKYRLNGKRAAIEIGLSQEEAADYLLFEAKQQVKDWFPKVALIPNSRISAKEGMSVPDLFTKRTLACHSRLLSLIEEHSSGAEKALLKVAFTANLANCSKLVPPIKSRGEMAPGAWMTGFYVGETYLENNVLTYFENRFKKIISGKQDFLNQISNPAEFDFSKKTRTNSFHALQDDAKNLSLDDESVDYIFTDPPYGDAVPYFEQSIIWNSWLGFEPDYSNEIVISDSKSRKKNHLAFESEMDLAFREIRRVLKSDKFFSLTYHSLSGKEWKAITNACINNGFILEDFQWLVQKSFTPRQINRMKTIKGDVLITFKKSKSLKKVNSLEDREVRELFKKSIADWLRTESLTTNEIFLRIMKKVFSERILITNVDLLQLLTAEFKFDDENNWVLNDELELC